ncbi:TPA: hypothetical protein N0F65_004423 [Lagenidium giganteum]|uniref:MULE transposase domain-containing protein n=1 Tax=Lagenidium giganteum TaxID=4803 RepID=A0AAV2ZFB9_9STRA|nr:TPA: hypothetical protein N0F65_004423 [Lagenidium giganteum]
MFTKTESVALVGCVRQAITGGNVFRLFESPPDCYISLTDERNFLQCNVVFSHSNRIRMIVGFGHPELSALLKYRQTALFVDGIFYVAPKPFEQCVILMVHDRVPCMYFLVDGRDEIIYRHILRWVKEQSNNCLDAETVVCDFEQGMMNAIRDELPKTGIVGCLLHWKQALRRKMASLGISRQHILVAMAPGNMDLMTVAKASVAQSKGMPYVQRLLNGQMDIEEDAEKWQAFWKYFAKTWVKTYSVDCWNISAMARERRTLVARTNNALEAYNRAFAEQFAAAHLSIMTFVHVAKLESIRFVQQLRDVARGVQDPPARISQVDYPRVPRSLR